MHTIRPSSWLKTALLADAATGAACGFMLLAGGDALRAWLGLPGGLLAASAVFLLGLSAMLFAMWRSARLSSAWVRLLVVGNLAWALASVALLAWVSPTPWGTAFVLGQAATVALLAVWEWVGLRASAPADVAVGAPLHVHRA